MRHRLRDPAGPHKVDMIIALTHCRLPNVSPLPSTSFASQLIIGLVRISKDIRLANELAATVGQDNKNEHGVDCLIGGHDQ